MATMRQRCRWCGLLLEVPIQARSVMCPGCQTIIQLQRNAYYNHYQSPISYPQPNAYHQFQPTYSYAPPPPPQPRWSSRKRAVLCGVTYRGHKRSLEGSINNVKMMRQLLVDYLGFPSSSVVVLTEDERDPSRIPTKANIKASLSWLARGCQPGDSLVFYYSGHASQVTDRDGDEMDGLDEALCPVDYETEGKILDDDINEKIVRPLPRGVTLHAIIDTCFSGTFLDLPYMCRMNREGYIKWENHHNPYSSYRGTSGGTAISISACDDHQNSADTTAFTGSTIGCLTYSIVETLKQAPKLTYGQLLMSVRERIDEAQSGVFQDGKPVTQVPQLSSSERFEIHSKVVSM